MVCLGVRVVRLGVRSVGCTLVVTKKSNGHVKRSVPGRFVRISGYPVVVRAVVTFRGRPSVRKVTIMYLTK